MSHSHCEGSRSDSCSAHQMLNINQELSIVIIAKNEEKYIGILLDSILEQDYPRISETQIIVADADSKDRTREITLSYSGRLSIKIVKGGLPSFGRNAGAKNSQSDYILFIDADIELADQRIIRKTIEMMKEKNLHCATTNIYCRDGNFFDKFLYQLSNFAQKLSRLDMPFATGMFMMFKRDIFNSLGGFDERVEYSEDYFLTKKIERNRFAIIPGYVLTTNRRFKKTGYLRKSGLFLKTLINRKNDNYFLNLKIKDYWE